MVLTTLVAGVIYGWIEGWALRVQDYGTEQWLSTQNLWIIGHFSTYSVAMLILFACITGAFSLIKGRSMFVRGKRYFLFTFAGNYPFAWLVEDFAFFWFYPDARLNDTAWTNWAFGGFWLLDPWRSGVKIWMPNWYWIVLVFWICMMWYAHRCTVYDALVKDEIARDIIPRKIEIPRIEVKKPVRLPEEVVQERPSGPATEKEAPKAPKPERVSVEPQPSPGEVPQAPTSTPKPEQPSPQQPALEPRRRSPEAEEALKRLREKWIRNGSNATGAT
jgi:hypothetical protein